MKSILFVCTGNIFRSMIAEYALKAVLGANSDYKIQSAGIIAAPQEMFLPVKARLRERGIDPSGHQQRKLTTELLNEAHLIVAMGLDHYEQIQTVFKRDAVIFNEIYIGKKEPILDIHEHVPNYRDNPAAAVNYALHVVDYICDAMPTFSKNMEKFIQ